MTQSLTTKQPKKVSQSLRIKRPLRVTLLAWLVLSLTVLNGFRLTEVVRRWEFLSTLEPAPPVLYIAVTGLLWSLVGITLIWGLVLGRSWAPRWTMLAAIAYALYYWIDKLLVANPVMVASRWFFGSLLTLALLVITFLVLSSAKARSFFSGNPPRARPPA